MMYGTLAQWKRDKAYYPEAFARAFAFLQGRDASVIAPGRYDIDGDDIYAMVQDAATEDEAVRRFETHARYMDIQLLLTGEEKQLFAPDASGAPVTEDGLAERDTAFHARPARYNSVILEPGSYAVYFPGEPHAPCCAAALPGGTVRKIVFKIARR